MTTTLIQSIGPTGANWGWYGPNNWLATNQGLGLTGAESLI